LVLVVFMSDLLHQLTHLPILNRRPIAQFGSLIMEVKLVIMTLIELLPPEVPDIPLPLLLDQVL
jgi:hypothetical protein